MEWIGQILDVDRFGDAAVYFIIGSVATILFVIRLVLALFMGGDGGDFDVDVDGDVGGGSDGAFQLFSVLSVTAFFMGTGWMGLACRYDWQMGGTTSLAAAVGFGFVMMVAAAGLMGWVRTLGQEKNYDASTAIGATGRVYLTIPAAGGGRGQVEVNVSDRRKVMHAITKGSEEIPAFTAVTIVGVEDDDTMIVEVKE